MKSASPRPRSPAWKKPLWATCENLFNEEVDLLFSRGFFLILSAAVLVVLIVVIGLASRAILAFNLHNLHNLISGLGSVPGSP